MLVWSSNLVDFQALIQTNFLQNRSLKIYFPLVTGHPVHMYIAEVYLLHCSSNLVAPSSPPRASTMYPVCISLSLFLSSSLSAFHVHAHGFISLSLSLSSSFRTLYLRLPPLYPSPSRNRHPHPHSPFHSAPTSENGFPTWTWNGFRKVLLTCGHPRKHTPHTWPHSVRVSTIRARTATHTHTHIYLTGITMIDTRVPLFSLPPLPSFSLLALHPGSLPVLLQLAGSQPEFTGATTNQDTGVRRVASPWAAPFQNEFFFPLLRAFLSSVCVRVCVCVRVFFFTVTTRLTRSNEGMIGKLEAEDRAVCSKGFVFTREHFFSLSLSLSLRSFFFGSFFLPSHLSFVSINSFSPFSPFLFFLFPLSFLLVPASVSFFRTIGRFRCYWREWMDIGETVVCERFLYWRVSCYSATAWLG